MPVDTDFGFDGYETSEGSNPPTDNHDTEKHDLDNKEVQYDENGNPIQNVDGDKDDPDNGNKEPEGNNEGDNNNENELTPGSELEFDGNIYKVDDNGNVVDAEGNIFKEAKDVKEWLNTLDVEEDSKDGDEGKINIANIQKAIGITITDEDDKEIEFEDSIDGIKNYVDSVLESKKEENYDLAISSLFEKYPFVEPMINYYLANGNSLDGYNEQPDRSNIEINETDEAQQESIIKTAWKEQNRKGDVNGYIAYLKSTGNLLTVAKEELEGLIESDKQAKEAIEKKAQEAEQQRIEEAEKYWNGVHDIIKSRTIGKYNIPESIIVERDGKKIAKTPEDFFNYLYRVDDKGYSRYNYDLSNEKPEDRLNDEILRAYLKFTGGNYTNLVDMAINKKEVNKLVLKSKQNKGKSVRIRTNTAKKDKNVDLGY